MGFFTPPPLKVKPPCPAVRARFLGLPQGLVRSLMLVSAAFWIAVFQIPAWLIIWLALSGWQSAWRIPAMLLTLAGAVSLGFMLGLRVSQQIIFRGWLHQALKIKPQME